MIAVVLWINDGVDWACGRSSTREYSQHARRDLKIKLRSTGQFVRNSVRNSMTCDQPSSGEDHTD